MADPPPKPPQWRGADEDPGWSVSSRCCRALAGFLGLQPGVLGGVMGGEGGRWEAEGRRGAGRKGSVSLSWRILGRGGLAPLGFPPPPSLTSCSASPLA